MNKRQRELQIKMNNNILTKDEYKEIDKKLYPFPTRIKLFIKYYPGLFSFIYIVWLAFISIVTSLLVVNFAVI